MGIIRELSMELANQIAAGEVVERPASAVKELVENAIDAGATMITVRIERGGISRIQVTDNGCGMMKEDALECFKRHATSKIFVASDLSSIYTMGFRGEALSSISAVSQVDLYTKREQDENGTHVVCTDGTVQSCTDEGMPNGTTFVISNLFYNIPARMKFLKRDATEASYITDLMARFVLSHSEISFRYINSRKEVYFSAGDQVLENCVFSVYGKDYAKAIIPVSYTYENITVTGVAGKSDTARPNRAYQSFFVNKRYIKSTTISTAVEKAYKNQIMVGKYPMVVLNIDIDASLVDVNVHPAKMEVDFSNNSEIFSAVFHALENALYSEYSIPKIERIKTDVKSTFKADIVKSDAQYEFDWAKNKDRWSPADEVKEMPKRDKSIDKNDIDVPESYKCDVSPEYFEQRRKKILKENINKVGFNIPLLKEELLAPDGLVLPTSKTPFCDVLMADEKKDNRSKESEKKEIKFSKSEIDNPAVRPFKVIGQVFSTYVIVESGNEMLIIDQHAAHERLKYEELKKELENKMVSAQDLLIPVTVELSPVEYAAYAEHAELLNNLGFEADDFGGNSMVIRTAPTYVAYDDISQLLVELLEQMSQNKSKPISQKAEYAVYTIACKAALKANHNLDIKELEALVAEIFKIEPINTCPHGRPIIVSMTKKEIEKEFKRIL